LSSSDFSKSTAADRVPDDTNTQISYCIAAAAAAGAAAAAAQDALDACNGWEVDRQVEQAMDSLR
jgi:hypothetical protein